MKLSRTVSTSSSVPAGVNRSTGRRSPATTAAAPYGMACQSGCAEIAITRGTRISLTQDTFFKVRKQDSYRIFLQVQCVERNMRVAYLCIATTSQVFYIPRTHTCTASLCIGHTNHSVMSLPSTYIVHVQLIYA